MSAGLPEKPNSLDILLKVALAGTESAAAEKESDKSLSSSETYTPTHKPSSKKRPLGDISATVSNQSSNHSQPTKSLKLTKENLNLV